MPLAQSIRLTMGVSVRINLLIYLYDDMTWRYFSDLSSESWENSKDKGEWFNFKLRLLLVSSFQHSLMSRALIQFTIIYSTSTSKQKKARVIAAIKRSLDMRFISSSISSSAQRVSDVCFINHQTAEFYAQTLRCAFALFCIKFPSFCLSLINIRIDIKELTSLLIFTFSINFSRKIIA